MKNIHLLPTEKPSRLFKFANQLHLDNIPKDYYKKYNIYITSDEKIKEGDWGLSKLNEVILFGRSYNEKFYKKIILTTDQDLIADGVQAISDEFLEWFVKNPSCEFVEIKNVISKYFDCVNYIYKIIIPQQEPYILECNDGEITIGTEISASQEEINFKQSAVEWFKEQFNKYYAFSKEEIQTFDWMFNEAKEMEFEQRKKDFVNGYKSRAKESNLIFDETSEMYAIKLFNETFKSE
jgi:hypothetical protein